MMTKLPLLALAVGLVWIGPPSSAVAGDTTVECISHNYQYNECYAPLNSPQLVYQSSHAACIVNSTWGFNPASRRIWVAQGCSGVFADPGGYHHGQAGTYDKGARTYDHRGHDNGAVVAEALLGALLVGAADSAQRKDRDKRYSTSNAYHHTHNSGSGYTGCHGVGCLVDDPDAPPEPGQTTFRRED